MRFPQGEVLSCDFYNLMTKKLIRAELNRKVTIFEENVQLLTYADDADVIGFNYPSLVRTEQGSEANRYSNININAKYLLPLNKLLSYLLSRGPAPNYENFQFPQE